MLREAVFERLRGRLNAGEETSPRMWGLLHRLCEVEDIIEPIDVLSVHPSFLNVIREFGEATPAQLQEIAAAKQSDPFILSERKKLGDKAVDYSKQIDDCISNRQAFHQSFHEIITGIVSGAEATEPPLGDNAAAQD